MRVKTAQTTPIALDGVTEGSEYKLTVTGRQSGKAVTVDFQAPAANSADKNNGKPGAGNADKNGVIASGKVNNDTKPARLAPHCSARPAPLCWLRLLRSPCWLPSRCSSRPRRPPRTTADWLNNLR